MSQSQQRLFVGNLPPSIESHELEELFLAYGNLNYYFHFLLGDSIVFSMYVS